MSLARLTLFVYVGCPSVADCNFIKFCNKSLFWERRRNYNNKRVKKSAYLSTYKTLYSYLSFFLYWIIWSMVKFCLKSFVVFLKSLCDISMKYLLTINNKICEIHNNEVNSNVYITYHIEVSLYPLKSIRQMNIVSLGISLGFL